MPNNTVQFNGKGPIITPEQQALIDNNALPNYSVIINPNNAKISTGESRRNWWNKAGRVEFSNEFNDVSIDKKGEFNNRELERIYRNVLFKEAFGHLKDYGNLKTLSPEDRDNFYTEWQGRTDKDIVEAIYKKSKKKDKSDYFKDQKLPHLLSRDTWENSPKGRQAAIIKGNIEAVLPINTNNWSIEDRKKFYDNWYDKDNENWNKLLEANQKYPELFDNEFVPKTQNELDDYYKNSFDRFDFLEKLHSIENPHRIETDERSVSNPDTFSGLLDTNISDFEKDFYQDLANIYNTQYNKDVFGVGKILSEDSFLYQEATKKYPNDALAQNDYINKTKNTKEFKDRYKKYSNAATQKNMEMIGDISNPENYFLKPDVTVSEQKVVRPLSKAEEKLSEEALRNKRIYEIANDIYKESENLPFGVRYNGNSYDIGQSGELISDDNHFPFKLSLSTDNWKKALKTAEEFIQKEERYNSIIPSQINPYSQGISENQFKNFVRNYSGIYQKFNGSDWMPEDEIPYNDMYDKTKKYIEDGRLDQAIYTIDKEIENKVVGKNQTFFGTDNQGHMSSSLAAANQFFSMGVESLVESTTMLPSVVVGFAQAAFNPTEVQQESNMSFYNRMLDNMIHNDWLGILSNQSVSDWAANINEDAVIYGSSFGDLVLSGSGTAGAQVGNLLTYLIGMGELKAAQKLTKGAVKSTERLLKKELVANNTKNKFNLYARKATENLNLAKANYGEAMQQSLEGERLIYEQGESRKKELVDNYKPTEDNFEIHYNNDELEEAINWESPEWADYWRKVRRGEAAIPPEINTETGRDLVAESFKRIQKNAEGLHRLYEQIPDYNDNIALNAKMKANIDLATQTTLLLGFDKVFGGLDKWTLDFAMGRRALKPNDLINRIKGVKIGNLKPDKQWARGILTASRNPIMETITEVGQQSGSALTKQIAEYNIDSFLENQLYGNGLQSWAATTYEGLWNLDKDEFSRDAEIKRTILQTLLTTPLMPVLGGYRNRSARGQNQSWVSRALENIHYYSPIKTTLGEQLYNIGQHNKQLQAAVDYINRWGADPVNQNNTRGLIGFQNYSEKMIADLINNDEVSYNNDIFSRTLSEAIMLANTQGTEFAQDRLQWLTNMAEIKSATPKQKAAAIKSIREEAAGNSVVRNLSDEELLNLMEASSSKVLDAYNKVNDIINSDEKFTDGTYNWQQQSALIFNRMAREDLQTRVADKESRIQAAIQSLGEIDLGESKTSKENVEDNKVNNKKVLLSGRDILALSPMKRAAMLSPRNLNNYSSEQQKIIKETINALNQVDGNIINNIRNAGLEEYYLTQIEKDYKASLQTPGWESKRVKTKANNIKKAFSSEGNTKTFNKKLSKSASVQDVYNTILNEREANATRDDDAQIDIESTLNNIQDPTLKQKVEEARKIERTANSIKSTIASTNLTDNIKDSLFNQVDRIASESSNVSELTDISKYNIPLTPDGQDLSGTLNNILQTATQNASNTQTVNSKSVNNFSRPTDDVPEPTDLGERGVDTAMPVNEEPLKKYTLDEAKQKLKELNDALVVANNAETSFQHDTLLINASILKDDLEKKLPEGYELQPSTESNFLIYKIVKTHVKKATTTSTVEDKKDDITDIDSRKEEPKQPIDRDGITKVAEILFEKEGRVYSYPIRDEDVQLGDGVNGPFSSTGRVVNIRDVQDDAEAEFLIYQTDKKGNFKTNNKGERIKRDRPKFINRHFQDTQNKNNEQLEQQVQQQQKLETREQNKVILNVSGVDKRGKSYTTKYIQTINEDGFIHISHDVTTRILRIKSSDLQSSLDELIGKKEDYNSEEGYQEVLEDAQNGFTIEKITIRPNGDVSITTNEGFMIEGTAAKEILNKYFYNQQSPASPTENSPTTSSVDNELITVPYTAKGQPTRQYTVKDNVIYNEDGKEVFSTPSIDRNKILANAAIKLKQAVVVDFKNAQYVVYLNGDIISVTSGKKMEWPQNHGFRKSITEEANRKFAEINQSQSVYEPETISNRTEYQQSVIDNNITPAVTELDGTALSKGLFEPNQYTGQPNVMRQLQEEGAFDYMNKGALTEGDEIEFVVSQEQMPDGSTQVVIWEVTEPKDGVERTNPKWHGKQLLNVLDQTEVGGKRKELIDRIRKAYEEAGRPESLLYPDERFVIDNISHSIVPFRQTNPTEASSEETIESNNLQKGLIKKNGVWGTAFFNKAKGKMVHVPIVFRQAKKDRSRSTKILLSDQRLKSKTIEVRKTAVGGTGEMNTVSMVLPTPKGFVSVNSVYILTKDIPNSSDKYEESVRTGSVGKALVEKIKAHLSDIKTVSAFSDYLGFRRGYSEYIYNDRSHGRIDLGYRGSTGNTTLISAVPQNGKYILVDPTDARNILNDNNGQGFTLDEVCKEYLTKLVDNPEADVTMRLNMEAIESKPEIITDLIDDGLLWAPDSLNARFTAANTQFNASLNDEIKGEPKKDVKQKSQQLKETPKPAPVVSNINPSATTTEVKKAKPKVDDTVELGSKVKRRKLKVSKDTQITPESPTTPSQTITANTTVVSAPSSFETLSAKDKQHVLTKVTQEEWENLTKEERDNILNC